MRAVADLERIRRFMRRLGAEARRPARVYFTGGATAVLLGWRPSTIDVDLRLVPEHDELLRALPALKEDLRLNIELASPADFIPVADGWEDRSPFIEQDGPLAFHHFDLCAQALAKIERGHQQDMTDVRTMLERGLVTPADLRDTFARIEPFLYRYPAVDPRTFRAALERALAGTGAA
jgi:hypothetical protein